jgi:predicted nucleic acid-binding protein
MTAKSTSNPWAYFDTSALVKRYVQEPGRREVLKLLRKHDFVTSALLPVELRSAFRRRVMDGTLSAAKLPLILRRAAADRAYWTLVEVGTTVLSAAETLVATHPIRTLDAIHVASAQLFAARLPSAALVFVSADQRQTEAAIAIGLSAQYISSEVPVRRSRGRTKNAGL